ALALLAIGCSAKDASVVDQPGTESRCEGSTFLRFFPEPEPSVREQYVCFAFDASDLAGAALDAVFWSDPLGGTVLHHATLLTTEQELETGVPLSCDPMPQDVEAVHVWSPGGDDLRFPEGVALELSSTTRRFLIEAHVVRKSDAPAGEARVELCPARAEPLHLAARIGISAQVPALRPHFVEISSTRCRLPEAWHLLSAWPHMHKVGSAFQSALWRGEERIPIVDLPRWDFNHQRTYELDLQAEAGDVVETTCIWENPNSEYVLPGPLTENEMCTFGLTGYPREAARCEAE
ncbi:MAG TPA: hypothetical protein VGK73_16870, partial [Polyangiaceae bacterium]